MPENEGMLTDTRGRFTEPELTERTTSERDDAMREVLPYATWKDARWLAIDGAVVEKSLADGETRAARAYLAILAERVERLTELLA